MEHSKNRNFDELRQKAEKLLAKNLSDVDTSQHDFYKLMHELNIYQAELEIQNEELKKAQDELALQNEEYTNLYDFAPCGYVTLSPNKLIKKINLQGVNLLQEDKIYITNMGLNQYIAKECQELYYDALRKAASKKEKQSLILKLKEKNDRKTIWIHFDIEAIFEISGEVKEWRLILIDVTEMKELQIENDNIIIEKNSLFHELQHRIKNSLSIILSMMNISYDESDSEHVKQAITEISSRVKAISDMYLLLDNSSSFENISLDDYLNKLITTFPGLSSNINIKKEFEPITYTVKNIINIGLIITELVTNSIKYAFPKGKTGNITISLKKVQNRLLLEVSDDGIGLPDELEISKTKFFGLKLVETFTDNLDGKFNIKSNNGTKCSIDIPL